jgi:hypothetical protein
MKVMSNKHQRCDATADPYTYGRCRGCGGEGYLLDGYCGKYCRPAGDP